MFLKVKEPALVCMKVSISTLCGQLHLAIFIVEKLILYSNYYEFYFKCLTACAVQACASEIMVSVVRQCTLQLCSYIAIFHKKAKLSHNTAM